MLVLCTDINDEILIGKIISHKQIYNHLYILKHFHILTVRKHLKISLFLARFYIYS
jgi:hypothetical protein